MSGKLRHWKHRKTPPIAAPEVPHSGQLFKFPKPKKPRGRPKKAAATPSSDDFDIVCAAIRGIPKGKRMAEARAEARRIVGADKRSSHIGAALFGRILDALNHAEGKDWHSVGFYAGSTQLDRPKRSVERAYRELSRNGHVLRRRVPAATGGWDISETTSPTLARAANVIVVPANDAGTDENNGTPTVKKSPRYRPINRKVPTNKYTTSRPNSTGGTDEDVGLISKTNFQGNLKDQSAGARTRQGDFQKSNLADGAKPTLTAQPEAVARSRDTTLPLAERITIDGDNREFLEGLAKGWPLATLRDQFCTWIATSKAQTPTDAQRAFNAWMITTEAKRVAPTAQDLAAVAGSPEAQIAAIDIAARKERWEPERRAAELAKVWVAEDKADAPLRAPFSPITIKHRLQTLRLARCNALILRKLRERS